MKEILFTKKIIIVTGHYGSGKTNISINLALRLKKAGRNVTLIDFDVVNPYFRAADSKKLLTDAGIKCIIPEFANSNVDIPALPGEIYSVFNKDAAGTDASSTDRSSPPAASDAVIFDVGGDDAGATALGMYSTYIKKCGYDMLYVINARRPLIADPKDAVMLMRDIESASHLSCTGIVNNTNLGAETDRGIFESSFEYANETACLASLPLVFDSFCTDRMTTDADKNKAYDEIFKDRNIFKMNNYTKTLYGGIL